MKYCDRKHYAIQTQTYLSTMCGNSALGPDSKPLLTIQDVLPFYFGKDHNSLERYIDVVTYGTYTFEPINNTIYDQIIDVSDAKCTCTTGKANKCTNTGCSYGGWLSKLPNRKLGITKILIVPDQVVCSFGGMSGKTTDQFGSIIPGATSITSRGLNIAVLVHELFHTLGLNHSGARCDASSRNFICTLSSAQYTFNNINTVGDVSCVMGYGGTGRFVNVAVAHKVLKCVFPIIEYTTQNKGTYKHVLPAMELTNINCIVIKDTTIHYYISYHKPVDITFYNGNYDNIYFDNCVLVHSILLVTSVLEVVIQSGQERIVQNLFTVSYTGLTGQDANISITIK